MSTPPATDRTITRSCDPTLFHCCWLLCKQALPAGLLAGGIREGEEGGRGLASLLARTGWQGSRRLGQTERALLSSCSSLAAWRRRAPPCREQGSAPSNSSSWMQHGWEHWQPLKGGAPCLFVQGQPKPQHALCSTLCCCLLSAPHGGKEISHDVQCKCHKGQQ